MIADKPADAVDACWIDGGRRTNGIAQIGAQSLCETTYPPHSLPDQRAGKPLDSLVAKCQLQPLDPADYGSPDPGAARPPGGDLPERGLRLLQARRRRAGRSPGPGRSTGRSGSPDSAFASCA